MSLIYAVAFAGWACHLIFQRFEPRDPLVHLVLLLFIPGLLSFFLSNLSPLTIHTTYLCSLAISTVLYRLSPFHPLARYPGPWVAKTSKLWSWWLTLDGKQHKYYRALHQRYGDVVRIGPNDLSFCTVDAVGPIMGPNGMPKSTYWEGRLCLQTIKAMIGIRDPKHHATRRRPWTRAFNPASIRDYEPIVKDRVKQLVQALMQRESKDVVDLAECISFFAYDLMGDMAFGGGTELLRDGDINGEWHALEAAQPMANTLGLIPWFGAYVRSLPQIGNGLKNFRAAAVQRVLKRKENGSVRKDLFHHLIDEAGHEPTPPPTAQVTSDATLAMIAGSDTTATVLSNACYHLLTNPSAYARLREEVDGLFDAERRDGVSDVDADGIDMEEMRKLPWLNAVINESLRLHPPVLDGSSRAPEPRSGGRMVGEYWVPEGTTVLVHTYALHRDERYFSPHPDSFHPQRWLAPNSPPNPQAFVPFSYGPENCVGKAFALLSLRISLVLLVHHLDMEFDGDMNAWKGEEGLWERELKDRYVLEKGRLEVKVRRRG